VFNAGASYSHTVDFHELDILPLQTTDKARAEINGQQQI
jgi:hypothetical protein